jgi:hypothetical protein
VWKLQKHSTGSCKNTPRNRCNGDAAATAFIIECKTVNWKNATQASEAIYKLSALRDIGGLNTKAVFVSLYDLPDAAKTRAAEHNIQVVAGQNSIVQLKQRLLSI